MVEGGGNPWSFLLKQCPSKDSSRTDVLEIGRLVTGVGMSKGDSGTLVDKRTPSSEIVNSDSDEGDIHLVKRNYGDDLCEQPGLQRAEAPEHPGLAGVLWFSPGMHWVTPTVPLCPSA